MAMLVTWWERRDAGEGEAFGTAALNVCCAGQGAAVPA